MILVGGRGEGWREKGCPPPASLSSLFASLFALLPQKRLTLRLRGFIYFCCVTYLLVSLLIAMPSHHDLEHRTQKATYKGNGNKKSRGHSDRTLRVPLETRSLMQNTAYHIYWLRFLYSLLLCRKCLKIPCDTKQTCYLTFLSEDMGSLQVKSKIVFFFLHQWTYNVLRISAPTCHELR